MQTDAVRVGLVGYGFAGQIFHAPLIGSLSDFQLVAVASRQAEKVFADLPDVEVMLSPELLCKREDLDLIVIASPNDSHASLAHVALEAGKHVVVDKPFVLNLAEGRDLIAKADRHDRLLSIFHNRRWDSDYLSVSREITRGLVGRVTHFESHIDRYRPTVQQRWREQAGPGSGLWFDLGPHLVDQALQLFGLPERVYASLAIQRNGAEADDWVHAILDYSECRVILQASMLSAVAGARFVVHGEQGSLVKRHADQQEAQLLSGLTPGAIGWGIDSDPMLFYNGLNSPQSLPTQAGDQRCYYAQIAKALRGEGPNPVTPLQALAVMAVIEAGTESARLGAAVPLPLTVNEQKVWR